jgi:hypothetical protein
LDLIQPLIDAEYLINAYANRRIDKGSDDHRMLVFLYVDGVPQHCQNHRDMKAELFREIFMQGSKGWERLMQIMKLLDDHDSGKDHHLHCPDT